MQALDAALHYAELGYRVIPCNDDKEPLTRHGSKDGTTDADLILRWWERWPDANVAICTGFGVCVFDLDPDSQEWVNQNEDYIRTMAQGVIQVTPRGGRHYVFAGDMRNSAGDIAPGVDTRGRGGYFLAWPSQTEDGEYSWVDDLPEVDLLPRLPAPLERLWRAASQRQDRPSVQNQLQFRGGVRNDALYRSAIGLLKFGTQPDELGPLLGLFNESRCDPPLSPKEVVKIANSAARSEAAGEAEADVENIIRPNRIVSLDLVEPVEMDWLWPGRFPVGKMSLLSGLPGVGKSHFLAWLAASVTTGAESPDGHKFPQGGVVMISCEDELSDTVVPRLIQYGADRSRIKALESPDSVISLANDMALIREAIEEVPNCRLLLIDTITDVLTGCDFFRNEEVRQGLAPLKRLAAHAELVIVLLTHHSKGAKDRPGVYGSYGSIAFPGMVRSAHSFHPVDEGIVKFQTDKVSFAEKPAELFYGLSSGRLEWLDVEAAQALMADSGTFTDQFLAWVKAQREISRDDAKDYGREHSKTWDHVRRLLSRLVKDRRLVKDGDLWYLPDRFDP